MDSREQVSNQVTQDIKKLPEDFFDNATRNSYINESEPNDSFNTADIIYDSYDVYGNLGASQDTDNFKVIFSEAGTVNFFITCSSNSSKSPNYQIFIYNSSQKLLGYTSYSSSKVVTLELSAGTYYIRVVGIDDGGENYYNKNETYLVRCKRYPTASLNVPLYTQTSSTTCGPASMRMILAYYGIYETEAKIKSKALSLSGTDSNYTMVYVQASTLNNYFNTNNVAIKYTYRKPTAGYVIDTYQTQIVNSICGGYPVQVVVRIADKKYFEYTTDGHYMVITKLSFDGSKYIATVNDPHYAYSKAVTLPVSELFSYNKAHSGYIIYPEKYYIQ